MKQLNEEEQSMLDFLEDMHTRLCTGATLQEEEDHIRITKMNGMIPWNTMVAYCDNHNASYPDVPEFLKE